MERVGYSMEQFRLNFKKMIEDFRSDIGSESEEERGREVEVSKGGQEIVVRKGGREVKVSKGGQEVEGCKEASKGGREVMEEKEEKEVSSSEEENEIRNTGEGGRKRPRTRKRMMMKAAQSWMMKMMNKEAQNLMRMKRKSRSGGRFRSWSGKGGWRREGDGTF